MSSLNLKVGRGHADAAAPESNQAVYSALCTLAWFMISVLLIFCLRRGELYPENGHGEWQNVQVRRAAPATMGAAESK